MRHKNVTIQAQTLVAIGANLPVDEQPPKVTLRHAIQRLSDSGVGIDSVSRFFETPCFPAGAGPDYVNAVFSVSGVSDPKTFLQKLHVVEAQFARERNQRWGSRTLDLDLLACGDSVLPDREMFDRWFALSAAEQQRATPETLILPHPRMHERAFVLVPLLDIAPDWRHPVTGVSVREMVAGLSKSDVEAVKPL